MKVSTICFIATILLLDSVGFVLGKKLKNKCDAIGTMEKIPKKDCEANNECKVKKGKKCVNFVKKVCGDITNKKECNNNGCKFKKNKNTCKDKKQKPTGTTAIVKAGGDDYGLVFVPEIILITEGDSVKW